MSQFTKKKHFVGVDISKDHLDLTLVNDQGIGVYHDKKVENSFKGYNKIWNWLSKHKVNLKDCLLCMEHTGTYGLLFFAWLSNKEIDYCVEPALSIKRSMGITRGKSDKVDARRIAQYAAINKAKLVSFSFPSTLLLQIKQLLTYRDQLSRIRVALKNSIKNHNRYMVLTRLCDIPVEIESQIEELEIRIESIGQQIKDLIKSDETLYKNFQLATSVKGIGFVIASFMLITTNNFTSFENSRKYACYSGIAPFENSSGKYKGQSKVNHLANKKIKALLSNGAHVASKWDPDINAYYTRKIKEGKDHNSVINAIKCKLVNRVFAVVKRQTPYVNLYQQKFA